MNGKDRSNKSLLGKSVKMVLNTVKLSNFSIEKKGLGTGECPAAARNSPAPALRGPVTVFNKPVTSHVPGRRWSQEPQSSSKPTSYMINEPDHEATYMIQEEATSIDWRASDYIRRVHEKNRKDLFETSEPFILLAPPPHAVK